MPSRNVIGALGDGDVLRAFQASVARVQVLNGPLGSGKTRACIEKILSLMASQPVDADGVRRSRWFAVRNTYGELQSTTIKDWLEVVPSGFGVFKNTQPAVHELRWRMPDGSTVSSEMMFLSADLPSDEKKLRGINATGCWLNEMKELPSNIYSQALGRVGRYPSRADVSHYWSGLIGDSNAPDEDHWLYDLMEGRQSSVVEVFRQPGGVIMDPRSRDYVVNEAAENLKHLGPDYYRDRLEANRHRMDWVRVNLANEYGSVIEGMPVWPEYNDELHCADAPIPYREGAPLLLGIDFGRTPAAAIGQRDAWGRVRIINEIVTENMGARDFGKLLRREIATQYGQAALSNYQASGDPAGSDATQVDDMTPFMALEEGGIIAYPADTGPKRNDFEVRRDAVARPLTELVDGEPALMISPTCRVLRKGMRGAYEYKRLQVSGDARYRNVPDKGRESHVCEALQYLMCDNGEAVIDTPFRQDADLPLFDGRTMTFADTWAPQLEL